MPDKNSYSIPIKKGAPGTISVHLVNLLPQKRRTRRSKIYLLLIFMSAAFTAVFSALSFSQPATSEIPMQETAPATFELQTAEWELRVDEPGLKECPPPSEPPDRCRFIAATHLDVWHTSTATRAGKTIPTRSELGIGEKVSITVTGWGVYHLLGGDFSGTYAMAKEALPAEVPDLWEDIWGGRASLHLKTVPDMGSSAMLWLPTVIKIPEKIRIHPKGLSCDAIEKKPVIFTGSAAGYDISEFWQAIFECTVKETGTISLEIKTAPVLARQWPAIVPAQWRAHGCDEFDPAYKGEIDVSGHRKVPGEDGHIAAGDPKAACLWNIGEEVMVPPGKYAERTSTWQIPGGKMLWKFNSH